MDIKIVAKNSTTGSYNEYTQSEYNAGIEVLKKMPKQFQGAEAKQALEDLKTGTPNDFIGYLGVKKLTGKLY
jgi:hypothetical protein